MPPRRPKRQKKQLMLQMVYRNHLAVVRHVLLNPIHLLTVLHDIYLSDLNSSNFAADAMEEDKLDRIANTEARGVKQGEDASRLQQGASDTTDARVLPENDEQPVLTAPRAEENISEPKQGRIEGNKAKLSAPVEDMTRWASQGFSSLIVGAPYLDPWTVAQCMLPLLASSAPFVIYHPYSQVPIVLLPLLLCPNCR
jgi:hypothetical protein